MLCLITSKINHDQLVRVVSASYLHSEITISPFIIDKYCEEKLWSYVNIMFPSTFAHFGIYWWMLPVAIIIVVFQCDFLFPFSCLTFKHFSVVTESHYLNHSFKASYFQIRPLFCVLNIWIYLTGILILNPLKVNMINVNSFSSII